MWPELILKKLSASVNKNNNNNNKLQKQTICWDIYKKIYRKNDNGMLLFGWILENHLNNGRQYPGEIY